MEELTSIEIAAQCWCDEFTSGTEMDVALCYAFAKRLDAKQARIDELMLEYCPDEMTQFQMDEWERAQKRV